MATVMSSTPIRQPFGVLSETKLRSLQSVKNKQNAITPNSAPSLKRRAPSPDLSDSENVEPNLLDSFGKRKRTALDDDVSLSKPSRYSLHVVPSPLKANVRAAIATPRLDVTKKAASTPLSAPAAAGRSPIRGKRTGILKPGKNFMAPSFGMRAPALSITAALKGTLAHKKAKKARTIEESKPKSWFFDIFEESEEQQDYKMNEWTMTQSATILDISDDEGKTKDESDQNKENIDPDAMTVPVTRSMSAAAKLATQTILQKDVMTDEPRTPLGDLNPSEYYAEGLDATSVVLVHDEVTPVNEEETLVSTPEVITAVPDKADFTFESMQRFPEDAECLSVLPDIGNFLAASEPVWLPAQAEIQPENSMPSEPLNDNVVEIWESESAKDEAEREQTPFDDGGAFALQDL